MKIKVVLASLAVVAIAVVAFSFAKKPTATMTYYFDNSQGLVRGPLNGSNLLVQSEVKMAANWITTPQTGTGGDFLNAIKFDQESSSDGIADGQYTLQEAIDQVYAEYVRNSQYTLPGHNASFTPAISGASPITIERASSN